MTRISGAFLAAAWVIMGLPTASLGAESLRESLEVRPGGRLVVELDRGNVEVVSHESDAAHQRA